VVIQDLLRADAFQCFEGSGRSGGENGVACLYLIRYRSNSAGNGRGGKGGDTRAAICTAKKPSEEPPPQISTFSAALELGMEVEGSVGRGGRASFRCRTSADMAA
jgi:hypothetical protein